MIKYTFVFVLAVFALLAMPVYSNAFAEGGAVEDKCAVYTSPRAKSLCEQQQRNISRMQDGKEKRRARFQETKPKTNLQKMEERIAEEAAAEAAAENEAEGVTEEGEAVTDATDEGTEIDASDSVAQDQDGTNSATDVDKAKATRVKNKLKEALEAGQ